MSSRGRDRASRSSTRGRDRDDDENKGDERGRRSTPVTDMEIRRQNVVSKATLSAAATAEECIVKLPETITPCALDARAPVAENVGASAHCIASPKLMRACGATTGSWLELRCYSLALDAAADEAGLKNIAAVRLDTPTRSRSGKDRRTSTGASSSSSSLFPMGGGDASSVKIVVVADERDASDATAFKTNARARLSLDIDDDDDDDDEAIGATTVLARVWPSATLDDDGIQLSRKVWLSMGCPPGGSTLGARALRREGDGANPVELDGFGIDDDESVVVHLTLWALEADVGGEAAVWLDRGLKSEGGRSASRQRGILEALAKRALSGRGVLVGNLVRLPLLGTSALFEVSEIEGPESAKRGVEITSRTRVALRERKSRATSASASAAKSSTDESDDSDGDVGAAAVRRAARAATSQDVSFESLGGVEAHEAALRELVTLPLTNPKVFTQCGVKPPRGVLLYGPPGSGKTRLARAAAHASNAKLFVVNGPELVSAHLGESEEALRAVFLAAIEAAPSVILLDELDAIAPSRNQSGGDGMMSSRIVATMLAIFDGGSENMPDLDRVVVIATTNRPDAIERSLRRPGRFDREMEVGVPTPKDRLEILRTHLRGIRHSLPEEYVIDLAKSTHGFVGADVAALCQHAAMHALSRVVDSGNASNAPVNDSDDVDGITRALDNVTIAPDDAFKVTVSDFDVARVKVRPSALREVAIEIPRVAWDDVGGLDQVKDRLKEAVEWAEKHPDAMQRVGASAPKGILLYGPPGCSKTMLARAVASASGRNFISIKGSELFSKWVGDSEKAVRSVFARARTSSPSVIFIDEVDGLAGTRGGGGEGGAPSVQDRVITQLLGEMDGLAPSSNVTVVAATNRPDLVDGALLRPGRFDRLLYVPPPVAAEDRESILKVQFKKTPLADDVDLKMLALSTKGYTGADLSAIAREAALVALEEDINADKVYARHVGVACSRVRPSPPPRQELVDMYEKFQRM